MGCAWPRFPGESHACVGQRPTTGRPSRKRAGRILKVGSAVAVAVVGACAVLANQGIVASDDALVSAYVISLRSPINGVVSGIGSRVGAPVKSGDLLAHVENTRVNDQSVADLQAHLRRVQSDLRAADNQLNDLAGMKTMLSNRWDAYRFWVLKRMDASVDLAQRTLDAKVSQRDQAQREWNRKAPLAASGYVSQSDLDKARAEFDVADRQAGALRGQLAASQIAASAATQGVLTEGSDGDVPYSAQRQDEVSMRIADVNHTIASLQAEEAETRARLDTEDKRIGLMRSASMLAPAAGMIWKLGASQGEWVSVGDSVAEVVDCRAAFFIAAIPQDEFSSIKIGSEAHFRLSGETLERVGQIVSVTGDASLRSDRNLAATPLPQSRPTAMVRVSITPSENSDGACLVGRTARVLLPTTTDHFTGGISRALHNLF